MNVVIDVLAHHRRERSGLQHFSQIRKTLFLSRCIQFVENGNINHVLYLSSA